MLSAVQRLVTLPLNPRTKRGFTMIELLVVTAIIGILILVVIAWLLGNVGKARDAERKTDLDRIKIAFEDYYTDYRCYPPADVLENCASQDFSPYLQSVPCDPVSGDPYVYVPLDSNGCAGYRVYAELQNLRDPAIAKLDCDTSCGCGYGETLNYGVSAGVTVATGTCEVAASPSPSPVASPSPSPLPSPSPVPTPSPTPSPSASPTPFPSGGAFACDPAGTCNFYGDPAGDGCPKTYSEATCQNECHILANRCAR